MKRAVQDLTTKQTTDKYSKAFFKHSPVGI